MYATLFEASAADPIRLADDVFERYIGQAARIAANSEVSAGQIVRGIKALVKAMLARRMLANEWGVARKWISHEERRAIETACNIGGLCEFVGDAGSEIIQFRHDRLFEYFAVLVFVEILSEVNGQWADLVSDPFYSEYVGRALAVGSQIIEVERLTSIAPLALVAALDSSVRSPHLSTELIKSVQSWLSTGAREGSALLQAHWFAWLRLLSMNSPAVLSVTEGCPRHPIVLLARFANGDAIAGIEALSGSFGFRLGAINKELEVAAKRAVFFHRDVMVHACANVLSHVHREEDFHGCCALAGFLEDPILTSLVYKAWEGAPWCESSLDIALWACLRCGGPDLSKSLEVLFEVWATLPEEVVEGNFHYSPRRRIARSLSFAIREGITDDSVETLTTLSDKFPNLRFHIALLLERLYTAPAIRYVALQAAHSAGMWRGILCHRWRGEDLDEAGLPNDLVSQILEAADSQSSDPRLSQKLLSLWTEVTRDVERLRNVPANDESLRRALRRRLQLGDRSVVVMALGQTKEFEWNEFRRVWCEDLFNAVDAELTTLSSLILDEAGPRYDSLAELLFSADEVDVAKLLLKHWTSVRLSNPFIYLAIFSGNSYLLQSAADEVLRQENPRELFEEFHYYFEYIGADLQKRIKPSDFDVLALYVRYLPLYSLNWVARSARSAGLKGWCEAYIRPAFEQYPQELFRDVAERNYVKRMMDVLVPTDNELCEQLDEIELLPDYHPRLQIWIEHFVTRADPPERVPNVLRKWLASGSSSQKYKVAGDVLAQCGHRADLAILDQESEFSIVPELSDIIKKVRLAVYRRTLT